MNLKAPKLDIKNILVLNIDNGILEKLCFRETLLISRCLNVANERECYPFIDKCSEECPNEEQCDHEPLDPDDIDNELFHPKAYSPPDYSERKRKSLHDENLLKKRDKWKSDRNRCKKTKACRIKKSKVVPSTALSLNLHDHRDDDEYILHGEDYDGKPEDIRILKLDDCSTSGGFCINIENVGQHLLLYLASQFGVDGFTAGSSILSTSDLNLTLIEERKSEFIVCPDEKVEEKCLHVALDEDQYVVIKCHKKGDEFDKESGKLAFSNAKDMLFDGAGIIMMRYMAITNFRGKVELTTMLINGDIACVVIRSSGYKKAWLCNALQKVIEIEKIITEKCGIVHKSLTVLTPSGHMIKHEWEGCDYMIHINPITEIPVTISGLSTTWENDIELFSRFLDYRSKRKADHKSYMLDTPEVRAIVSDYIEYILLTKPSDILNYTIDYFKCLRPF